MTNCYTVSLSPPTCRSSCIFHVQPTQNLNTLQTQRQELLIQQVCSFTNWWQFCGPKMDTGSANSRRQSYGVNSKGVIAGKPYHVWTPLPAAPYSCVNITVQAVNEQTWFKEQITEQKQPMPFKGSTLSYQSSINRSVDRSCCMYLLASHCLKVGCYVPAWYGTIYKQTKKTSFKWILTGLVGWFQWIW